MKLPSATLSVRISFELWEKISEFAKKNDLELSSGSRKLIDHGLWLENHKEDIQDPEKSSGIIAEWAAKMNEKEILEWPKTLSENQISATIMSLEMEKERRFKQ